jgi:hypothetical protein
MTVAQLVHPFHSIRDRAQLSPWERVRAMQQSAVRRLGDDTSLWGAIGAGWLFALTGFGILVAALAT